MVPKRKTGQWAGTGVVGVQRPFIPARGRRRSTTGRSSVRPRGKVIRDLFQWGRLQPELESQPSLPLPDDGSPRITKRAHARLGSRGPETVQREGGTPRCVPCPGRGPRGPRGAGARHRCRRCLLIGQYYLRGEDTYGRRTPSHGRERFGSVRAGLGAPFPRVLNWEFNPQSSFTQKDSLAP